MNEPRARNGTGSVLVVTLRSAVRQVRRLLVLLIGTTVLLIGVIMFFTPGPAVVVIPIGLGILAIEFAWARLLLKRFNSLGLQQVTFSKFGVAMERTHDEILPRRFLLASPLGAPQPRSVGSLTPADDINRCVQKDTGPCAAGGHDGARCCIGNSRPPESVASVALTQC